MNVLLTGATGFIGRHLTQALVAAGHRVVPAGRAQGADFARLHAADDWLPWLEGIDGVINAVGIIGETRGQRFDALHTQAPLALFQACAHRGVRRVIQISALGADATAFSAYHLSKRQADEGLRRLDVDWFVLRPSLIYGPGGTSTEFFLRLAALPRIPVVAGGNQEIQPIHISDVVATVLACLTATPARQTLDLAGPETVTFAAWLRRLRAAQGLPATGYLSIPYPLARAVASLGRHFNPLLQPDNLRMLVTGYRADPAPLARFLGRPARAFSPNLLLTSNLSTGSSS